jgi:division protein CdvB (Snf7/Vps24/ESCRT-III family)
MIARDSLEYLGKCLEKRAPPPKKKKKKKNLDQLILNILEGKRQLDEYIKKLKTF